MRRGGGVNELRRQRIYKQDERERLRPLHANVDEIMRGLTSFAFHVHYQSLNGDDFVQARLSLQDTSDQQYLSLSSNFFFHFSFLGVLALIVARAN